MKPNGTTWEGISPDGVQVRVHVDRLDAEYAYLYTRMADDRSTWRGPLQIRKVHDDAEDDA